MTKGNTTADEVSDAEQGRSPEQSKARARLRMIIQQRDTTPMSGVAMETPGGWFERQHS